MGFIVDWLILFPLVFAFFSRTVVVGDSLTLAEPGFVEHVDPDAERVVCYHLGDCIVDWPTGKYDLVVVELGIHAVAECDHLPAQDMVMFDRRYRRILDLATENADTVVVVNIPALWRVVPESERVLAYNAVIAELAAEYQVPVADAYAVTFGCTQCIGEDGFHPSPYGYEAIGREIIRVLEGR